MAGERNHIHLGDEGSRLLQGREHALFPWPVRPRIILLLWAAVAILCLTLVIVIVAGDRALG
jgi:hypothetical protein